jgi:hypothetical protein
MIFQYLDKCEIEINRFNRYFSDLQSFFYEDYLDMVDIAPLHHFHVIEFKDGNVLPVPTSATISLSDRLHIMPITSVDKIRLWNKFPISRLDDSFEGINYVIEYKFKERKGFEGVGDQGLAVNTLHIFSTIVTLFRFVEVHCGIHDKAT